MFCNVRLDVRTVNIVLNRERNNATIIVTPVVANNWQMLNRFGTKVDCWSHVSL